MSKHHGAHSKKFRQSARLHQETSPQDSRRESDSSDTAKGVLQLFSRNAQYYNQETDDISSIRGTGEQPVGVATGEDGKRVAPRDGDNTKGQNNGTMKVYVSSSAKDNKHAHKDSSQQIEATLEKKQYAEEDVDFEHLQAKLNEEEEEKCHEWIDKTIDRILFNTAFLTMICALMTAFACYVFVQLPYYVYSHHILNEIFLVSDNLMNQNGFSRNMGLHSVTPLPVLVIFMYAMVLYFIYLVNYPKAAKVPHYMRLVSFVLLEVYMITCALSYIIDAGNVGYRLDAFFKRDKMGLKGIPDTNGPVKLMLLERSQEYFGCCGYRNMTEWKEVHEENYSETWPLSCCDEVRSDIACYGPVKKKVVFFRREEDQDELVRHEEERLFADTCFKKERSLSLVVISLIAFSTVIFVILSSWTALIFLKLSYLILTKNLELRHRDQYIDFF